MVAAQDAGLIKNRKWMGMSFLNVFVAKEGVDFLLSQVTQIPLSSIYLCFSILFLTLSMILHDYLHF